VQDERADDRFLRALQELHDVQLLDERGVVEAGRDPGDLGDEEHEQQDVRRVELPAALEHLEQHVDEAVAAQ
jgi:hypothetical protein